MNELSEITTGTALALPERTSLEVMFRQDGGLDPLIAKLEAAVKAHVPDLTTKKGRDAIKSLAYNVARSKTALDEAGKQLNEEARAQIAVVDAARRKIRDKLDALRDEARKPLDEWEAAEEARVEALKARLDRLANAAPAEDTSDAIKALITRVEQTAIDDSWAEYLPHAGKAKDATLNRLRAKLVVTEQREAEQAELARLRAEAEARAEEDRKRKEAEEAEARRIEAQKAEAERLAQIEREKQEAAERAKREAEEKAEKAALRAAAEALEAENRHKRALEEAERRAEAAAQAERDRIEAERIAEAEAQRKREENTRIRNRVKREIVAALTAIAGDASPEQIADALIAGSIPHCTVRF